MRWIRKFRAWLVARDEANNPQWHMPPPLPYDRGQIVGDGAIGDDAQETESQLLSSPPAFHHASPIVGLVSISLEGVDGFRDVLAEMNQRLLTEFEMEELDQEQRRWLAGMVRDECRRQLAEKIAPRVAELMAQ